MSQITDNPITHLTKVEIRGLWGQHDIDWDLNSDVNVLAGINGSGKSTIINCLAQQILIAPPEIENVKRFYNKGVNDRERWEQHNSKKNKSSHSFNLDDYPLMIISGFDSYLISTFDNRFKPSEAIQKLSDDRVKTDLDWKLNGLQGQYVDYQFNVSKKTVRILKTNNENKNNDLENLQYPQERFLEIVDELFSETSKKINRDKNQLEFLLADKEINVYQLSSGEKQLLIILLTVLIQDNKPSILLMDEPEISLHIEWQRKLIKYIRELNPNVQLIIATHSPDIIMDGWLDKIFNLQDLVIRDNSML